MLMTRKQAEREWARRENEIHERRMMFERIDNLERRMFEMHEEIARIRGEKEMRESPACVCEK